MPAMSVLQMTGNTIVIVARIDSASNCSFTCTEVVNKLEQRLCQVKQCTHVNGISATRVPSKGQANLQ